MFTIKYECCKFQTDALPSTLVDRECRDPDSAVVALHNQVRRTRQRCHAEKLRHLLLEQNL